MKGKKAKLCYVMSCRWLDGFIIVSFPCCRKYLVGLENGLVSLWDCSENKRSLDYQTGQHLSCVRPCSSDPTLFATGGKENDLKIWKLDGESKVPIFKAKNVPHVLELRVPVWVQDATFLPQTTDIVAVSTRYGHVRVYDTKVDNRNRPVINMEFCDHPLMSIASTRNDRQVIVGSAQGKVGLVDIRNYAKEKLVHLFLGFNGSVRNIVADENTPYFVSCSLDRFLYLHNLNEKQPLKKVCTCLINCKVWLYRTEFMGLFFSFT